MATALDLPTLTPGQAFGGERGYALRLRMAYLLAIIFALALIAVRNPPLVKFREQSIEDVVATLAALTLISAFLERAVEVFVAAWRVGEQQQLEIRLQRLKADRAGCAHVKVLRLQISQFRHDTRMYSLAVSVVLRILVSLAGVRALAAVVEAGPIERWYWHNGFFSVLDVLITGALLGGGADAIHKVVSAFTTFVEATKSRVKGAG